jgi:acyl-CoA synthetase (AMP-forming)/AMP-acid ligase II
MLRIFKDVCKAIKYMHTYKVTESSPVTITEDEEAADQMDIGQERSSQALLTHEESAEEPATVPVSSVETENVGEMVPYGNC